MKSLQYFNKHGYYKNDRNNLRANSVILWMIIFIYTLVNVFNPKLCLTYILFLSIQKYTHLQLYCALMMNKCQISSVNASDIFHWLVLCVSCVFYLNSVTLVSRGAALYIFFVYILNFWVSRSFKSLIEQECDI